MYVSPTLHITFPGDVILVTSSVLSYCEPMQIVNEYRSQGQEAALAAGDVYSACMLRLTYVQHFQVFMIA